MHRFFLGIEACPFLFTHRPRDRAFLQKISNEWRSFSLANEVQKWPGMASSAKLQAIPRKKSWRHDKEYHLVSFGEYFMSNWTVEKLLENDVLMKFVLASRECDPFNLKCFSSPMTQTYPLWQMSWLVPLQPSRVTNVFLFALEEGTESELTCSLIRTTKAKIQILSFQVCHFLCRTLPYQV